MPARFELHGIFVSGPTYKVGLMLSLVGEPFDYAHLNMMEGEHKQPAYLSKQRYGQVPLLIDRSNGRYLCQSAAILEYLADTLGKFGGATLDERLQVREWLYWDFDRLAGPLYKARVIKIGIRQAPPEVYEDHLASAKAALKVLDTHLAGRDWLVGEGTTIADIDIYGVIAFADAAGIDLAEYPNVAAWAKRVEALPGFKATGELLPKSSREAA
ncbi:glutathione S-transferase family protein [Microvirga puerhi]|uniref:Glutathione S-transferase family protein n=1 Tax=Microvirga puerhi TaxID=2876078 RepID=A0ABS7VI27_9HYPH|nr:glutathione S-transferase family protein [Microvirga puerhi]MBZ6074745.1 glutathione S-transferase family protein [Microvirga puerhi]